MSKAQQLRLFMCAWKTLKQGSYSQTTLYSWMNIQDSIYHNNPLQPKVSEGQSLISRVKCPPIPSLHPPAPHTQPLIAADSIGFIYSHQSKFEECSMSETDAAMKHMF